MRRLLVRPGAIGDCLCSLPALYALQGSQETEIWTNGAVAPLVGFAARTCSLASTGFHLLGVPGASLPIQLLEALSHFDEILSWSGHNLPELQARAAELKLPIHFFPALPELDGSSPEADWSGHVSDYFFHQTQQWHGLRQEPEAWQQPGGRRFLLAGSCFNARPQNQKPLVVLHPFSGSATKNWPLGHFRRLAETLSGQYEVRWCASPEDPLPSDLAGQAWRFEDLCALARDLSGARLYVGNDSGVTHLAAMLGIPTVVFFGPMSPRLWQPRGAHIYVAQTPQIGQPTSAIPFEMGEQIIGNVLP